jgi:hypothetical protein
MFHLLNNPVDFDDVWYGMSNRRMDNFSLLTMSDETPYSSKLAHPSQNKSMHYVQYLNKFYLYQMYNYENQCYLLLQIVNKTYLPLMTTT